MKKNNIFLFSLLLIFTLWSCEDLEVENPNQPKEVETNIPSQVNGIVSGLFNGWFMAGHDNFNYEAPGLALFMAADVGTCSFGNFAMRDISSEPRTAFNNTPAYPNMVPFEDYYKNIYATLSLASDVLMIIKSDENNEVEEPQRAMAVAYLMQGMCLGNIGLIYDKGFVVTEYTDVNQDVEMVSFDVLIDTALNKLDRAIEICENNTFTIPASWLSSSTTFTNVEFGQLANTIAARLLTYSSRNAAQNASKDWNRILQYAQNGLTFDFDMIMDDINLWDYQIAYAVYSGWGRIDMRVINMMDPDMHPWFPASGEIADLPNNGVATSADLRLESDFEYISSQDFHAERGIYHFSTYRYSRFDYYLATWTEAIPIIRKAENDLLIAEANVRIGNLASAANILNDASNTRKSRGGLPNVDINEDDLLDAIFYEKTIECILCDVGIEFFDMRRRDLLQEGTFLHLPIPAQQLEVMLLDFYTFGGTTGEPGVDYSTGGWDKVPGFEKSNYGY